jgi:FkbM family methyltransferase
MQRASSTPAPTRFEQLHPLVQRAALLIGPPLVRAAMQSPVHVGKRQLWSTVGKRFFWKEYAFTTHTRFGATVRGNTRDIIQAFIYYFGVWEPHLTAFIEQRLRPGDVFVDVGANIGYFALCASRAVGPAGRVVAFEASPRIHAELLSQLGANRADNVRTVNCAVAASKGKLPLYCGPADNTGMTTTVPSGEFPPVLECEVEADALSALLTEDEVRRARIVKVDVEGAEWSVADGMRPILASCRDDLEVVMEVSPKRLAAAGHSAQDLLGLFAAHGFHAYALDNSYEPASYVPPVAPRRPVRIDAVSDQTDVVFSRLDCRAL